MEESGKVMISLRIERDTLERLRELADVEGVSVSEIVRRSIERYMSGTGGGVVAATPEDEFLETIELPQSPIARDVYVQLLRMRLRGENMNVNLNLYDRLAGAVGLTQDKVKAFVKQLGSLGFVKAENFVVSPRVRVKPEFEDKLDIVRNRLARYRRWLLESGKDVTELLLYGEEGGELESVAEETPPENPPHSPPDGST